ncbi:Rds1 protein [Lentinus tigrinus ALCF2SS1-7]|uniref:Rds1 protein n=1 Tax=Lentinus tigrinus ALCF2SS1-6 TaxID=1328759 RepID=A0A5C2RTU4_9APHY|nr:Rds1 protein [Lentinus tigrinus ALCF2SS1-6]RPD76754.1 Rds1 protein [Lentinus tigrinus ALCF2SS1-7]
MFPLTATIVLAALAPIALAAPYVPKGGLGTNSTPPVYHPLSDFDVQSLSLALYQEYIELDLFHYGLAKFSTDEFDAANITAEDRFLLEFMADQEVGHANLITNILGPDSAPKQCNYSYPFETVRDFIDFSQKLTRFGESGVYGFLEHLDSRASANLLLESIATEGRQQMIFRQFEGLFPMPVYFIPGITQSMAWTLLAPYIVSCPENNTVLAWQNFPGLNITNNPNASTLMSDNYAAITHNRSTPLSQPGNTLNLTWEAPGKNVGPNNMYNTSTNAGEGKYVAWISQLNTTYTNLTVLSNNTGSTIQPDESFINGTMFVMITDDNPVITPFNVSMLNDHIVAGPALYQSG